MVNSKNFYFINVAVLVVVINKKIFKIVNITEICYLIKGWCIRNGT
jgi:hypothetical protein